MKRRATTTNVVVTVNNNTSIAAEGTAIHMTKKTKKTTKDTSKTATAAPVKKLQGKRSTYASVILEAVPSLTDQECMAVETIMRDDIFHSTLDWQTRTQLKKAAREADAMRLAERATEAATPKVAPKSGWDGTSAVLRTTAAVKEAYKPVVARATHKVAPKGKAHMVASAAAAKKVTPAQQRAAQAAAHGAKIRKQITAAQVVTLDTCQKCGGTKTKGQPCEACAAVAKAAPPTVLETKEKVDKAVALAAKVAKKSVATPVDPPTKSALHKALKRATFKFVQAKALDGMTVYGYAHKDSRAAIITITKDGVEAWQVRYPDGSESGGQKLETLASLLKVSTARHDASVARASKKLEKSIEKYKAAAATAGPDATVAEELVASKVRTVPPAIAGVPAHVVRAVEMLGGITKQKFNLDDLRGDKYYGARLSLLKKLFNRERVLVAETGINKVLEAFYSAVGVGQGTLSAKASEFTKRCKAMTAAARAVKSADTREREHEAKLKRLAQPVKHVPGVILPVLPKLSKKQKAAKDAADKLYVQTLAVSSEQPAVPHPDAEVVLVAADLRLLEDPENGIVMLQMERENSQGAICVYNNGSRVAAGVVPPETLKRLRTVTGEVDLIKSANQLLNPLVPSVPVTSVATRHLTAVVHCKELIPMTASATVSPVSAGSKFAAPASTKINKPAAKAAKAAPAKTAKAAPAKAAPAADRRIKAIIKVKDVTLREGTFCYAQVMAALTSGTVAEAQAKLDKDKGNPSQGRRIEVSWLAKQGFIKVIE